MTSALLLFRNRDANRSATLTGVTMFTCGAHQIVYRILSRWGMSISYSTTIERLKMLAAGADEKLKAWGKTAEDGDPKFQIVFDNINKMQRAWEANLGEQDILRSGTAAAVIKLEDVPPNALKCVAEVEANIEAQKRKELTVEDLLSDIDWNHTKAAGVMVILRVWFEYIPSLSIHKSALEALSELLTKLRLRLRKTTADTLRCSDINEATTAGIGQLLEDIFVKQLHIDPKSLGEDILLTNGDQLSVNMVRKFIDTMEKTLTPYSQHKWLKDVIQLWHMKYTFQKSIIGHNWYPNISRGAFGLHHDAELMGRGKLNPANGEFYPMHHLLVDRFNAIILEALRYVNRVVRVVGLELINVCSLQCEEATGVSFPITTNLVDGLRGIFLAGPLAKCSFDTLHTFAESVYDRYMQPSSADNFEGARPLNPKIYGKMATGIPATTPNASSLNEVVMEIKKEESESQDPNLLASLVHYGLRRWKV